MAELNQFLSAGGGKEYKMVDVIEGSFTSGNLVLTPTATQRIEITQLVSSSSTQVVNYSLVAGSVSFSGQAPTPTTIASQMAVGRYQACTHSSLFFGTQETVTVTYGSGAVDLQYAYTIWEEV
jgi:hypothetical protein